MMNTGWKMYALEDEKVVSLGFCPKTVTELEGKDVYTDITLPVCFEEIFIAAAEKYGLLHWEGFDE